jgi:hypothetical protein
MTKVAGFLGFLKRNTTGSTYATVGQLMSIGAVGSERGQIDVSAHGDLWEDIIPGRLAGNEVEATLSFDPNDAQHTSMKTDYDAGTQTVRNYQLQHPAFTTRCLQFPAYLVKYEEEATDDGAYELHVTFKIVNPGMTTPAPS